MLKLPAIALGFAAVLLAVAAVVVGGLTPTARAQEDGGLPAAPSNVQASDGETVGTVVVAWDAADGATFYRIGWVALDHVTAVQSEGREWLDAFAFTDVANLGQTTHTLTGLLPGIRYAFIVGSVDLRFGPAAWPEWAYLTLAAAAPISCQTVTPAPPQPTPTQMPMPMPMPTATPAPTPTPTPRPAGAGTSYDADGDGLIEVSNLEQLAAIRADLNGDGASPAPAYAAAFLNAMAGMGCPNGCTGYELVANLDFDTNGNGEADAGDAYWNDGAGWLPIGDERHKFVADFDDNNHTIANLYINRPSYIGLFGYASGSNIRQVGLVSANMSSHSVVGSLVGYSSNGTISDIYVTDSVLLGGYAGGIVGYSTGDTISNSYATNGVSDGLHTGGLVGYSEEGIISGSYATSDVTGGYYGGGGLVGESNNSSIISSYATGSVSGTNHSKMGGLIGHSRGGIISGSYATGNVSGDVISAGGLVGRNDGGSIRGSYATGNVSGADYVGGLVGENRNGIIISSYAAGSVTGSGDDIGGLVGMSEGGTITTSYSIGRVSASGETFYIGGLVGYDEGSDITASYWDTEASGQSGSYGGAGKTTAELQSPTGYEGIYEDWNLDLDDNGEADDPWDFGNAVQYPVLQYGGLDVAGQRR